MTKLKIPTNNIEVIELDTNKQYALIFTKELSSQDFNMYVDMLKENGMSKFISINDPSRVKLKELGGM